MNYHREIGICAKALDWVPSPTFILRRAAILDVIDRWPVGRALEVGCGAGAITYELAQRGFECAAVETSPQAFALAQQLLAHTPQVNLSQTLPTAPRFDYLLSFEVLEHIQDDSAALCSWVALLRPGGACLLSVPAHRAKWNVTDQAAGHFRRYDRADIEQLAHQAGLIDVQITSYGWPFSWAIEKLRLWVRARQLRRQGINPQHIVLGDSGYTQASGVQRSAELTLFPIYGSWLGRKLWCLAGRIQRFFYRGDRGVSFMVSARKPHD